MYLDGLSCPTLTCHGKNLYDITASSTGKNLSLTTTADFSLGTVTGSLITDEVSVSGNTVSHCAYWLKDGALRGELRHPINRFSTRKLSWPRASTRPMAHSRTSRGTAFWVWDLSKLLPPAQTPFSRRSSLRADLLLEMQSSGSLWLTQVLRSS